MPVVVAVDGYMTTEQPPPGMDSMGDPIAGAVDPLGLGAAEGDGWLPAWLLTVVTVVSEGAMIFGGVVPFIPQLLLIRRTRSCDGFNTMLCCNLMVANILRILFWFGRPFELPLLAQSIIMVVMMLYMMHACTETYQFDGRRAIKLKRERFMADFWTWTDYADYLFATASFTASVAFLTFCFLNVSTYVETLGFLAVFVEAIQAVPQFIRNRENKSTDGMSAIMPLMMTSGDTFKTAYFIMRNAPYQFIFCGLLQIGVDISLLVQVFVYRGNRLPAVLPKASKTSVF